MGPNSMFSIFFESLEDSRFELSDRGLDLALKVYRGIKYTSRQFDAEDDEEISEEDVKCIRTDFNRTVDLFEVVNLERNYFMNASNKGDLEVPENTSISYGQNVKWRLGAQNSLVVTLKAYVGVALYVTFLRSSSLLDAISLLSTAIVFGGIATVVAILLWEYRPINDVSQDSSMERQETIDANLMRTDEYGWSIRDTAVTILNVAGGAVVLRTFLYPSETLSVISTLITAIFFGAIAVSIATLLREYYGSHPKFKNSVEPTIECNKTEKQKRHFRNLNSCTGNLLRAVGHLIGITDKDSIKQALVELLKESEDMNIDLCLKQYLERCVFPSPWYVIIQKKYGVHFAPVVATFALVFIQFHDRNRFLLKCTLKTRRLKESSVEGIGRSAYAGMPESVLSDGIDKNLYMSDVWKHFLDFRNDAGKESEIYRYKPLILIQTQEALPYNLPEYALQFKLGCRLAQRSIFECGNRHENRSKLKSMSKSSQEKGQSDIPKNKQVPTVGEDYDEINEVVQHHRNLIVELRNCIRPTSGEKRTNVLEDKKSEAMQGNQFKVLLDFEQRINALASKKKSIHQGLEDEVPTAVSELEQRLKWLLDEGGPVDITELEDRFRELCSP